MEHDKARKSIKLQDIAQAVGVSRTTVSNAFNRPDQLSPELRDKILETAKEMGYPGPNPMARMLRTGQTGAIGLVFGESLPYAFNDLAAIAFLRGVSRVCERVKASLLIVPTLESDAAQKTIEQATVDGFIIYNLPDDSEALVRVLDRQLPVVAVDQPSLKNVPSVGIDDRQAARKAATHLLSLHHQQIAIIAMELLSDLYVGLVDAQRLEHCTHQITKLRLQGYRDALEEAGIDFSQVPIYECRNDENHAREVAMTLLQRHPRPTAILAMSDILAFGALRTAQQMSLKVPEDLSIVGFDDIPLAWQIRPRLTTVQQPLIEKGVLAAELLLSKSVTKASKVLGTRLVVRESSGIAPAI
ncbi:transcriptional regulator, LacI family [Gloeocapsa sp. PCC 7428]|uniref:LacI family DNA-binding transcriptional regulator n=1 Tax=Gloeocapsa sp. PCC 7428 TaxID=1173026 RepID=UPI0002A5CECE|nr:LacI family DNA-binding transcriptional regulator [Gloeocapsa sp. PCC 7428]AFZ30953.1 transcriptional regulator, LacI family [Gloeocapsa sp. PCC 7428]